MKEVMEQYGNILFAVIVGVLMITFLTRTRIGEYQGIYRLAGAVLDEESRNLLMEKRPEASAEYGKTAIPKVVCGMEQEIRKGILIRMEDICQAFDWKGEEIPVQIISFRKQNGEPCTWTESHMESYVKFPESGVYCIGVRVADTMGRETYAIVTVPVQE